ncbi:MAG: universal stress protein [Planctomycetaceae bacterium]|nr:MAG: universal stress protein [Planctomycetaceae bacterium]
MIELQRILYATDLSQPAAAALKYACGLAEKFQAELHVLSVIQDVALVSPDPNMPWLVPASNLEEVRQAVTEALSKIPDPAWQAPRPVIREIRIGIPFLEIIRYARDAQIDLLVIGTHGRTGLVHMLLGSTAEKIVRKAPCPVLTVHPEDHTFTMP